MGDSPFDEHPLDALLDAESEEEFGKPIIRDRHDHSADENVNGNLKNWSAQDFASIYVRFRPHLERHARRYLSNPVQAEEVVQDAFLYLMTTLPELDSELGVLKFLKWKIRLLCFDVLRSASNQRETPVPEHVEFASDDAEMSAELERAEDNAVIRMALSNLNPRQREVLVASVYEEKTTEEIADQLKLSPNATRQLLFRARSAFKKALIGEAEIQGKSVNQILSIAAKKAAFDAKQNALKVGAFVVLLAVGFGLLPSLVPAPSSTVAEVSPNEPLASQPQAEQRPPFPTVPSEPEQSENVSRIPEESSFSSEPSEPEVIEEALEEAPAQPAQSVAAQPGNGSVERLNNQTLNTILTTNVSSAGFYTESYSRLFGEFFQGVSVEVFGGTGISAFLDLNPSTKTVRQTVFQMRVDGELYFAVARLTESETVENGNSYTVAITSREFYVVDDQMNVYSESPLANSRAVVTIELDVNGRPLSASMKVDEIR